MKIGTKLEALRRASDGGQIANVGDTFEITGLYDGKMSVVDKWSNHWEIHIEDFDVWFKVKDQELKQDRFKGISY